MGKARLLGMQRKYIPNNRADILAQKKGYKRQQKWTDGQDDRILRREAKAAEAAEVEKRETRYG